MNWDAVGALGETVGAIAVVISLVYLAIQIRYASKTTQIQIEQAEAASIIGQQNILINNPSLGLEITPGAANIRDDLHMQKVAFWFSWCTNAAFNFRHAENPSQLDDIDRRYGQYIRYWLRNNDDFLPWWESASRNFPKDFVAWAHKNDERFLKVHAEPTPAI